MIPASRNKVAGAAHDAVQPLPWRELVARRSPAAGKVDNLAAHQAAFLASALNGLNVTAP
jgi:hypothetical protein